MAKEILIHSPELQKMLSKAIQSANLNFILGSGASFPGINVLNNVEKEVTELFESGNENEAYYKLAVFLSEINRSNSMAFCDASVDDKTLFDMVHNTINTYVKMLALVEKILTKRKNNLLPKQANLFTTNYDIFIEKASEKLSLLRINDGFLRGVNLNNNFVFSSKEFFNSLSNVGNLYSYKFEIPTINLIKIHGSLSWERKENNIVFGMSSLEAVWNETKDENIMNEYIKKFSIVLPRKTKFQETIMDLTYYDLLRIYANELDKYNTLLISFGFSFADEHIYEITKRALKNLTLNLIIFTNSYKSRDRYLKNFVGYNNVTVVCPSEGDNTSFNVFIETIEKIFTKSLQELEKKEDKK